MAKTNVLVRLEGGRKQVLLRDVDRESVPYKYAVIKTEDALTYAHPHERNCRSEEEALGYFSLLMKPSKTPVSTHL